MDVNSSNLSLRAGMVKPGKERSTKGSRCWEGQIELLESFREVETNI